MDKDKMKEACRIDNNLQRAGNFNNETMRQSHKDYSDAINETELLKELMKKYKK